jgi:hypothetical protein
MLPKRSGAWKEKLPFRSPMEQAECRFQRKGRILPGKTVVSCRMFNCTAFFQKR